MPSFALTFKLAFSTSFEASCVNELLSTPHGAAKRWQLGMEAMLFMSCMISQERPQRFQRAEVLIKGVLWERSFSL